ncbi:unnamed protein product [Amaranthus hypochondriacus]
MEGLIPYLVRAIKRQNLHKHSYRSMSDSSRRSYHLLGAIDSFNGSSHRRTQSEFQPPTAVDLQPEVDRFVRSRSVKNGVKNSVKNTDYNYN